jgi:PPM family protein phosphatase
MGSSPPTASAVSLRSAALSDVGLQRDHNEDAFVADEDVGLFLVCDGMGGEAAGEVASGIACDRVMTFFAPRVAELRQGDPDSPAFRQQLMRLADAAVQDACEYVYKAATDGSLGRPGMGTTLTMLLVLGRLAVVAHVGDSRLMLLRSGTLYHLTRDHSFVNEMVERGMLPEEDALKHPMAHMLTKAVGPQPNVSADTNIFDVYDGDVFLLCTDGMSKAIDEAQIIETLDLGPRNPAGRACQTLVDAANAAGGDDNCTVIVVEVEEADTDSGEARRRARIEEKVRVLSALDLFEGLSVQDLAAVVNLAGSIRTEPGDVVVRAGEVSRRLFVPVSGRVVLTLHGMTVLEVLPGVLFGDVEMFDGKPAMLEATVSEGGDLLVLERSHLENLCRRDPVLGVKLLWRFTTTLSGRVDQVLRRGFLTEDEAS